MTYYKVDADELKELLRCQYIVRYYRCREEYGERYCLHNQIWSEPDEDEIRSDLRFYDLVDDE